MLCVYVRVTYVAGSQLCRQVRTGRWWVQLPKKSMGGGGREGGGWYCSLAADKTMAYHKYKYAHTAGRGGHSKK